MKPGDLVRISGCGWERLALVVDVWKNHSRQLSEARILWSDSAIIDVVATHQLEVINESR